MQHLLFQRHESKQPNAAFYNAHRSACSGLKGLSQLDEGSGLFLLLHAQAPVTTLLVQELLPPQLQQLLLFSPGTFQLLGALAAVSKRTNNHFFKHPEVELF
jgi:hypothetical protein